MEVQGTQVTQSEVSVYEDSQVFDNAGSLTVLSGNEVEAPIEDFSLEDTEETRALRDGLKNKIKLIDTTYWEVARDLHEVRNRKLYKVWGYKTFASYVTEEIGKDKRWAHYQAQIFEYFHNTVSHLLADKPDEAKKVVEIAQQIGWSKAKTLAAAQIINSENALQVMESAAQKSADDLEFMCKQIFNEMPEEDKKEIVDKNEIKKELKTFNVKLAEREDIDKAIAVAKEMAGKDDMTDSRAIAMICRDFATTNVAATGGSPDVAQALSRYEDLLGLIIIAYDKNTGKIVYGQDNVEFIKAK